MQGESVRNKLDMRHHKIILSIMLFVMLIVAIVGFLGTSMIARFIERRGA